MWGRSTGVSTANVSLPDLDVLNKADRLLECGAYAKAADLLKRRLAEALPENEQERACLVMAIAGLLIDLGSIGHLETEAKLGLDLLLDNEKVICEHVDPISFSYNVGNGYDSLYRQKQIDREAYKLDSVDLLGAAKNYFWRAFQAAERRGVLFPELAVNLGISLSKAARVPEAIHWFDLVLSKDPSFAMAAANRSDCLRWFNVISDQFSVTLLAQIHEGYSTALNDQNVHPKTRVAWKECRKRAGAALEALGHTPDKDLHDQMETEQEAAAHTDYRKFCLTRGLVLSEHAVYCPCVGARRDDLSIAKSSAPIPGDFVPRMELILNRLKAEYGLARTLFFQATTGSNHRWELETFEQTYSELLDNEAIGIAAEMLRQSFRACFGILDRIALGVCDLLGLAEGRIPIFFESFWQHRALKSDERERRWQVLNEASTPSLVALYSQAKDLNRREGEWAHFRQWRNKLEHELLFLVTAEDETLGPLVDERPFSRFEIVPYVTFQRETLHMLRFTASAIFSFALFARQRALMEDRTGKGLPFVLEKKPLGPS